METHWPKSILVDKQLQRCCPTTVTENITYSLALRIVRNCSETETKEQRFTELKDLLLALSYQPSMVDAITNWARTILKAQALRQVERHRQTFRCGHLWSPDTLTSNYSSKILERHDRKNPYLKKVFPEPPLWPLEGRKSRIRETSNLSTDADSSADATVGWTENTQKPKKISKLKK